MTDTNDKPSDPDSSSPKGRKSERQVWFRFYHEAVHDMKLRVLTPAQRWLWVSVLTAASESPVRGLLLVLGRPMTDAQLADLAGLPVKEVKRTLPLFEDAGMIEWHSEMECWMVPKWDGRQHEHQTSTQRVRKHREMKRVKRFRNGPGNANETPPESEVIGQRSEDLAIASTEHSSPLSVVRDLEDEPPNHTAALNLLATRDMHERLRDQPDLTPIKYEIPWLMKTAQWRRVEFAHVLARLAPDLDVNAIIQEIDAADPHRRGEQPRWACTCEGSGMVPADTGFVLCPDCETSRRTA